MSEHAWNGLLTVPFGLSSHSSDKPYELLRQNCVRMCALRLKLTRNKQSNQKGYFYENQHFILGVCNLIGRSGKFFSHAQPPERHCIFQEVKNMNRENKRKTFEKGYYKTHACNDTFTCKVCGRLCTPQNAGSDHRNHCPNCLSSLHLDIKAGDRASDCRGIMEPVAVWVKKNGE